MLSEAWRTIDSKTSWGEQSYGIETPRALVRGDTNDMRHTGLGQGPPYLERKLLT